MAQIQDQALKDLEQWKESPHTFTIKKGFKAHPTWDEQWISILSLLTKTPSRYPNSPPVIELVNPQDRAWHAGMSHWHRWSPTNSLNSCTIGIEFQCPGYAEAQQQGDPTKKDSGAQLYDFYHFEPYCEPLQKTGISLIKWLSQHYKVPRQNVLAHSTIAWDREGIPKTDPGPLFFWGELAAQGLCYLPTSTKEVLSFSSYHETVTWVQSSLKKVGFTKIPHTGEICHLTRRVLDAYRMQYLPQERELITCNGPYTPESLITPLLLSSLKAHEDDLVQRSL